MKNLIISIVCLLLLMIPWTTYQRLSLTTTEFYRDVITRQLIPSVESEDWRQAEESFSRIAKDWNRFRKVSECFIDTMTLNDITAQLNIIASYIKSKDVINTMSETAALEHALHCLHENEVPSFGNIF